MESVGLMSAQETVSRPRAGWFTSQHKWAIGLSLLLIAVTVILYLPVLHHPFSNLDDQGYVYENLHVQEGLTWSTIKWAFTTFDDNNWHPLTWVSHAIDCQLYGIDPSGHHETNVIWHTIDAVLLFWVLLQATGFVGRSFMVAALFALHPINVESVAWVAERKTLLSTFFFLLALAAYRWYASKPRVGPYAVVAFLFACGLMAKPQIITLPCVLLLWDYWPLRRMFAGVPAREEEPLPAMPARSLTWLLVEKIPLLILCAASSLATMKAQRVGRPQYWAYTWPIRIENSLIAYVRYIKKMVWPSKLAIMYLHTGRLYPAWEVALVCLFLLTITALVLVGYRYRYLPVGWFWFLGTMVPTIGIVQVGRQALADRYAYQSFLGLFILVCWGLADWVKRKHLSRLLLPAVSALVLLALTFLTYRQIGYWNDNLTMWSHALAVTKNNWVAEDMVGGILASTGHADQSLAHYQAAAAIAPSDPGSHLFLAIHEQKQGNLQEAIRLYKLALTGMDDPLEESKAYQNIAAAYYALHDTPDYEESVRKIYELRHQAAAAAAKHKP